MGIASGGDDPGDVGAVPLGVVGCGRTAGKVAGLEDSGLQVGMLKGDPCIKDTNFNTFALGFLPEGWDTEKLEPPIDRLGGGQHHLIDLEWW